MKCNHLLACLVLALPPSAMAGENLLTNSGFEEGKEKQPTWWYHSAWNSQKAIHERTSTKKHKGKYTFHLQKETVGGVQLMSPAIELSTPDLTSCKFVVSGWCHGASGRMSLQLRYDYPTGTGKTIPWKNGLGNQMLTRLTFKAKGKWERFRKVLSIPRKIFTKTKVAVRLVFIVTNGDFYLDDLGMKIMRLPDSSKPGNKDFPNIVLHQPSLSPEEKSAYGPFPGYKHRLEYKDGIILRDGQPWFAFGNHTLAGSQWSAATNWMPRIFAQDMVDVMNSTSRVMTTRLEDDKLHIEFKSAPWSGSLFRELARMGTHVWHDLGTCKYQYIKCLRRHEDQFPELKNMFRPGSHFYPYDHNNAFGRELYAATWKSYDRYLDHLPLLGFEVLNELGYRPTFPSTIAAFRQWAMKKYSSLETANRIWHTSFKTRDEIAPPHLWDDSLSGYEIMLYLKQQRRRYWQMYYDWLAFLREYFVVGLKQMKQQQKQISPAPFCLDNRYEQNENDGYTATDPELVAGVTDIMAFHVTGFKFYNYNNKPADPAYPLNSLTRPFQYLDYMRTAVRQPIFSSECIFRYAGQPGSQEQYMIANSLAGLHKEWRFRTDPGNKGLAEKWYAPEFDDSAWDRMKVPGLWEDNSPRYKTYDGVAWYRTTFVMPGWCRTDYEDGTRRYLLAGRGLDDAGTIYVNGQSVFTIKGSGWNQSYAIDISDKLRYGQPNTIAVRINDTGLGGGIRFFMALVSDDMLSERRELNRAQLSALYWSHVIHGASGVIAWYWNDPVQTWLPELKADIESVAPVIMPRPRIKGKVGLLFSWDTYRGFFTGTSKEKKYLDVMEYMGGLVFNQVPMDVLSNRVFLNMKNNRYRMVVAPYARIVKHGSLAKLRSYVNDGGIAVLTYDSFSMSDARYQRLNLGSLAGVEIGPEATGKERVTYKGQTFKVSPGKWTRSQGVRLINKDARVLGTYADGSPAITVRGSGKGRIYLIAAELDFFAIHRLLGDIMRENRVESPLHIVSANQKEFPYIEAQVIGDRERFVLYLVNWGGQAHPLTVRVGAPYITTGKYIVRNVQNRDWKNQGKTFTAKALASGIALPCPVQMPQVYLFESTALKEHLKFRQVSPARKKIMARLAAMKANPSASDKPKVVFVSDHQNQRRNLLMGKVVHPLATQIMEQYGFTVHDLELGEVNRKNLTGASIMILTEDSKLISNTLWRNTEFIKNVSEYVKSGGSLLLAGSGSVHYNACNRLIYKLVTEPFKISAKDFCSNPKSCGFGDPLQLKVRSFAAHPLTANIRELQFFVCAGLEGEARGFTPVAFTEKNDLRHPGAPLVMAAEVGKGRMVVVTDNTWMQPFRVEYADNAQFLVNIINWLARKPAVRINKQELLESLFITEKAMRGIEEAEK